MLRRAVDEVSEMQAEARADAQALIAAAEAQIEGEQRKHTELLEELVAKRNALEAEYDEAKKKLDAELAGMRAATQSEIQARGRKPSSSESNSSPTPSRRPITTVNRPSGRWPRRAGNESRSWNN